MSLMKYLTSICLVLVVGSCFGQKHAEEAAEALQKGFYYSAIELYKKAYTTEKDAKEKAQLIFMIGECYRALGDAPQQQVWYEKANKARYEDPITYLYIGEAADLAARLAKQVTSTDRASLADSGRRPWSTWATMISPIFDGKESNPCRRATLSAPPETPTTMGAVGTSGAEEASSFVRKVTTLRSHTVSSDRCG